MRKFPPTFTAPLIILLPVFPPHQSETSSPPPLPPPLPPPSGCWTECSLAAGDASGVELRKFPSAFATPLILLAPPPKEAKSIENCNKTFDPPPSNPPVTLDSHQQLWWGRVGGGHSNYIRCIHHLLGWTVGEREGLVPSCHWSISLEWKTIFEKKKETKKGFFVVWSTTLSTSFTVSALQLLAIFIFYITLELEREGESRVVLRSQELPGGGAGGRGREGGRATSPTPPLKPPTPLNDF